MGPNMMLFTVLVGTGCGDLLRRSQNWVLNFPVCASCASRAEAAQADMAERPHEDEVWAAIMQGKRN